MALTLRGDGTGSAFLVSSGWWNDYYNLLTGVMTDQPVTLKYTPGASGSIPVLKLSSNGNAPLVQGFNGVTQKYQVDASGNVTASGSVSQFGDKLVGSGSTHPGMISSDSSIGLGSAGDVIFKMNNYFDGTNDRFTSTAAAVQIKSNATSNFGRLQHRYSGSGTAGTVITWGSWFTIPILGSNGGGAAGDSLFVGTTDPASIANEGDVWFVG